jgi:hypothetical protein
MMHPLQPLLSQRRLHRIREQIDEESVNTGEKCLRQAAYRNNDQVS